MRSLAIICPLLLAGCASLPPPSPHGIAAAPQHPPAALERPWLMPRPTDEITLFDSRTLQALRKLDEASALNQNGNGRRIRHPGMWAGIGAGAFVGTALAIDAAQDIADDLSESFIEDVFDCFFEAFFGGDNCDDED
jgi:hypothetical protein